MTVILTSFSLAWICSICIPWGRGSNGLLSITTSFLCQNSRTSSSGEQCIISSPSPINLSSSCFTKVGHEPLAFPQKSEILDDEGPINVRGTTRRDMQREKAREFADSLEFDHAIAWAMDCCVVLQKFLCQMFEPGL